MRKAQCKLRKIRRISVESLPREDDVARFGVGKAPPTRNPGHGERFEITRVLRTEGSRHVRTCPAPGEILGTETYCDYCMY